MDNRYKNVQVDKYRAILKTWGLIGQAIVCVKERNVDLLHKDKERSLSPIRLVNPFTIIDIEQIDILAVNPLLDGSGNMTGIELNNDPSLKFPLEPLVFKPVTHDNITAAAAQGRTSGSRLYFNNIQAVTEQVNAINAMSAAKAEAFAEEAMSWCAVYADVAKLASKSCEAYYEQIGLAMPTSQD